MNSREGAAMATRLILLFESEFVTFVQLLALACFGQVVAVGNVGLVDALAYLRGAVHVPCDLDLLFRFSFDALGVVLVTEFFGGVVAVLLQGMNLAAEPAKHGNG